MSRVSHRTPRIALDHLKTLFKEAGSGAYGEITRGAAKRYVNKLKREGRGSEALAFESVFEILDARHDEGHIVTGYALDKKRSSLIEPFILKALDANGNGFSESEIEGMSSTGRALIELGQSLMIEKRASRLSKHIADEGVDHVGQLLKTFISEKGPMTRGDFEVLGQRLNAQGRGSEALAVTTFKAIAFSGFSANRTLGVDELMTALSTAKERLATKDANQNGFSKNEVANMSKAEKSLLLLGQLVNAGVIGR